MTFIRENLPAPADYFESRGQKVVGKRGKNPRTTCGIHGGKNFNLSFRRDTGQWHCFSCDAKGGSVLDYAMQSDGLDFVAACKSLGAWIDDGQTYTPKRPKPIPTSEAQAILEFEELLVRIEEKHAERYIVPTLQTHDRLLIALQRIEKIQEAFA